MPAKRPQPTDPGAVYTDKPVVGFGPIGYVLAALLIALVVGVVCDGGVGFFFLDALHRTLGDKAMYWFVGQWLPWAWFQIREPGFGLAGLGVVLVLCHFSPRRVSIWAYLLLGAWGLLAPSVLFIAYRIPSPPFGPFMLHAATDVACTVGVLWCIMRRGRPAILAACGLSLAHGVFLGGTALLPPSSTGAMLLPFLALYYGALIAPLLWWAGIERARRRALLANTVGRSCGYDLRGLGASPVICPECGTERMEAGGAARSA